MQKMMGAPFLALILREKWDFVYASRTPLLLSSRWRCSKAG